MKRRSFLSLLGAAITAPAMPVAAASRDLMQVAVAHARKYPVISVSGLSKRGGMSVQQAEAMIRKLAGEGMVKLVGPAPSGGVRAASRIMVGDPWGIARTAKERQAAAIRNGQRAQAHRAARVVEKRQATWLTHLHDLCRANGYTLSPRAQALST